MKRYSESSMGNKLKHIKSKMNFGWESEEERLLRYMKIPPKKKLEWLQKMHELVVAAATPEKRNIFWKQRGIK